MTPEDMQAVIERARICTRRYAVDVCFTPPDQRLLDGEAAIVDRAKLLAFCGSVGGEMQQLCAVVEENAVQMVDQVPELAAPLARLQAAKETWTT